MSTAQLATWGDGTRIGDSPFTEVVPADLTEGRLVVLAAEMPVGLMVPEHTHDDADQLCVVLSGRVGGTVDGVEHIAEAGGVLLLPKGRPHSHWNAGDVPARVLEIYTPPGFEEQVRRGEVGPPPGLNG